MHPWDGFYATGKRNKPTRHLSKNPLIRLQTREMQRSAPRRLREVPTAVTVPGLP
jgi:hypothetical protein